MQPELASEPFHPAGWVYEESLMFLLGSTLSRHSAILANPTIAADGTALPTDRLPAWGWRLCRRALS
jgi:hypothetical protein